MFEKLFCQHTYNIVHTYRSYGTMLTEGSLVVVLACKHCMKERRLSPDEALIVIRKQQLRDKQP